MIATYSSRTDSERDEIDKHGVLTNVNMTTSETEWQPVQLGIQGCIVDVSGVIHADNGRREKSN